MAGSRRSGVVFIMVLALLAVAAWRVVSQGVADHFARSDPALALQWRADQPEALIGEAERRFDAGQPVLAAEFARRALLANPLEGRSYRVLGRIAAANGDTPEALRLFELAALRAPRDLPTHAWLARHYLQAGRVGPALAHIDARLRVEPQVATEEFPLLIALAGLPAAQPDLAALLAKSPPWRPSFITALAAGAPDSDAVAPVLVQLGDRAGSLSDAELSAWLTRLIHDQHWGQAYLTWVGQLGPAGQAGLTNVFNGGFEAEPTNLGFDWLLGKVPGTTIERLHPEDAEDGYALRISFEGRRVPFSHVRQLLVLAPGRYRLAGRARAEDLRTERGLVWTLTCGEGGPALASTEPVRGTSAWKAFSVPVTIPAEGCGGQWLQLRLPARIAAEQLVSGRVWFDDLAVTREP